MAINEKHLKMLEVAQLHGNSLSLLNFTQFHLMCFSLGFNSHIHKAVVHVEILTAWYVKIWQLRCKGRYFVLQKYGSCSAHLISTHNLLSMHTTF